MGLFIFFFFSSRRRHTRLQGDWSSDVCSSDVADTAGTLEGRAPDIRRAAGRRTIRARGDAGADRLTRRGASPPFRNLPPGSIAPAKPALEPWWVEPLLECGVNKKGNHLMDAIRLVEAVRSEKGNGEGGVQPTPTAPFRRSHPHLIPRQSHR